MSDMNTEPQRENTEPQDEENTGSFADEVDGQTPTAETPAQPPQDIDHKQVEINALKEEAARSKDQALRALAELENARKRFAKEREDAGKFAIAKFARDILDVADNLRRALDAIPDDAKADIRISNLLEGIEATEKELLKSFEKNGIQKVEPLDQPFDPNFHEVMFETPGTGKPPGTVVQVLETGYVLNERILRPARVGIAKDDGSGTGPSHPGGTVDTQA